MKSPHRFYLLATALLTAWVAPAHAQVNANAGSLFVGRDPDVDRWGGINIRATATTRMVANRPGDEIPESQNSETTNEQVAPGGVVANQRIIVVAEPETKIPDQIPTTAKAYMFASFDYVIGDAETADHLDMRFVAEVSALQAFGRDNSDELVPGDMKSSGSLVLSTNFANFPSTEDPGRIVIDPIPQLFDDPDHGYLASLSVSLRVLDSIGAEIPEMRGYWDWDDIPGSTSNLEAPITIDFSTGLAYELSIHYSMHIKHGFDPIDTINITASAGLPAPIPEPSTAFLLTAISLGLLVQRRR